MAKRHGNQVGNLESLFLRLEELVLANSGEDEFEEVFKLLIAKLWDERSGKATRFTVHHSEEETKAAITSLLLEANSQWPGVLEALEPSLTPAHLSVCVAACRVVRAHAAEEIKQHRGQAGRGEAEQCARAGQVDQRAFGPNPQRNAHILATGEQRH